MTLQNIRVIVDPGNRFVLLPKAFKQPRNMEFKLDDNRSIKIFNDQIDDNVEASGDWGTIILGRPFLRSLEGLYLDSGNRRIGFRVRDPKSNRSPMPLTRPNILLFEMTYSDPDPNRIRLVSSDRNVIMGFGFFAFAGKTVREQVRTCWVLLKVFQSHGLVDADLADHVSRSVKSQEYSSALLSMTTFQRTQDGRHEMVFEHIESDTESALSVVVYSYPRHIEVCEVYIDSFGPPPKPVNDVEQTCCICTDEYSSGEMRQGLYCCGHGFHRHCIRHWVKHQKQSNQIPTCPVCRQDIVQPQTSRDEEIDDESDDSDDD